MSSDGIKPSGTFDTNTATRSATDTVPPLAIERPIAADSGTPSSTLPSTTFSALPITGASASPGSASMSIVPSRRSMMRSPR
jgi:hypothetical protein